MFSKSDTARTANSAPSGQLHRLADALRPVLGMASGANVSDELTQFATKRHRVAPLLYQTVKSGRSHAEPIAFRTLKVAYESNVRRMLQQQAAAQYLCEILARQNIAHVEFKGRSLGGLLYENANWRHSADVDFLVESRRIGEAIGLLAQHGYTLHDGRPIAPDRLIAILRYNKEVAIRDPRLGTRIELHARLLNEAPTDWNDDFFLQSSLDLSNARYVLYLIVHGAASSWHRIKWLVDLARIAQLVQDDTRMEVLLLAKSYRCMPAIAASFIFCNKFWNQPAAEEWILSSGLSKSDGQVGHHLANFAKAIHHPGPFPMRQPLARRLEIVRGQPLFEGQQRSRLGALHNRIANRYLHH